MLKVIGPLVVMVIVAAVALATESSRGRADFTFANHAEINTLDPQKMSWKQDLRAGRMVYEGLVRSDLMGAEPAIRPAVAERWTISEDGRTYKFFLRPDAKWSNGDRVRGSDFVYTWRRALLPDTASDYTGVFQLIEGGKEFYDWRQGRLNAFKPGDDADALWKETLAKFDEMVHLKGTEGTLTFTLRRPAPYFLDLCAFGVFMPVYPGLVEKYETPDPATGRISPRSGWTKPGVLVGNGPFVLTGWRFKRDMDFAKSPTYWDRGRINFETVRCVCIEDTSAQVLACRSGAIDFVADVSAPFRADLLAQKRAYESEHAREIEKMTAEGLDRTTIERMLPDDPRDRVHGFDAFGTYFYNFNCAKRLMDGRENPFADARVRRAFALALDKERITGQVRRIGETPSGTLVPRGSIPGYESPKGLGRDVAEARRLLAEAGYPEGKGLPTIQVLYTRDAGHEFIAQSAKKDWEEVLGASVEMTQREVKVFKNDLRSGNFMVSRASWYGDYLDPTTFLDINRTGDGNNDRKYSSAKYDGLLDRAEAATDRGERMQLLAEAERVIVEEDVPLLPVFQYVELYIYNPHTLTGITSHPRQDQCVDEMDVLGDGKGGERARERPVRAGGGGGGSP